MHGRGVCSGGAALAGRSARPCHRGGRCRGFGGFARAEVHGGSGGGGCVLLPPHLTSARPQGSFHPASLHGDSHHQLPLTVFFLVTVGFPDVTFGEKNPAYRTSHIIPQKSYLLGGFFFFFLRAFFPPRNLSRPCPSAGRVSAVPRRAEVASRALACPSRHLLLWGARPGRAGVRCSGWLCLCHPRQRLGAVPAPSPGWVLPAPSGDPAGPIPPLPVVPRLTGAAFGCTEPTACPHSSHHLLGANSSWGRLPRLVAWRVAVKR